MGKTNLQMILDYIEDELKTEKDFDLETHRRKAKRLKKRTAKANQVVATLTKKLEQAEQRIAVLEGALSNTNDKLRDYRTVADYMRIITVLSNQNNRSV